MSLKKNIIANYVGTGLQALLTFAFIPTYIRFLGVESYGLVGILAVLQICLGLLDIGMRPALVREMARYTAGAHSVDTARDLVRSVEIGLAGAALLIVLGVWGASEWLATNWIKSQTLPIDVLAKAFTIMGVVVALRLVREVYIGCLAGLQRQVLLNTIISGTAIVRAFGAIAVLAWISPTIEAFFVWEGLVALASLVFFAGAVYGVLPKGNRRAHLSLPALRSIWRFAAGSAAITILSLLLTQMDKLVLARLLPLETFGYYTLAGTVATGLYTAIAPIGSAYYPRFTELVTLGDELSLRSVYHQSAQLVTVLAGCAAIVIIMFVEPVLLIWTGNASIAGHVAPILAPLMLGTFLNGLMWMPYQMQLAHGWTSLTIGLHCVAVATVVPAIFIVVPTHGAVGAAWIWVALNTGMLSATVGLMHRRILRSELWPWLSKDVAIPLAAAFTIAGLAHWTMPAGLGVVGELSWIVASACLAFAASAACTTFFRTRLRQGLRHLRSRASTA